MGVSLVSASSWRAAASEGPGALVGSLEQRAPGRCPPTPPCRDSRETWGTSQGRLLHTQVGEGPWCFGTDGLGYAGDPHNQKTSSVHHGVRLEQYGPISHPTSGTNQAFE